MFVGQIVAHEERTRTGELGFRHERLQRVALGRAGRAKLGRPSCRAAPKSRAPAPAPSMKRRRRAPPASGAQPIMERDPGRLLLDDQAGRRRGEAAHPFVDVVEPDRHAQRHRGAVGELAARARASPEKAMPRGGKCRSRSASERPLTIASLPPSRRRSRSSSGARPASTRIASGRLGELDQGAVEIEEQGGPVGQRSGGGGSMRPWPPVGKARAKLKPPFRSAAVGGPPGHRNACFSVATLLVAVVTGTAPSTTANADNACRGGTDPWTDDDARCSRRERC